MRTRGGWMSYGSKKLRSGVRSGLVAATLFGGSAWASDAHAAGIEDTVAGTIGLGRAAYYARVNDFLAVLQNPSNLAVVPRGDLGVELRLPVLRACYDRTYNPEIGAMGRYKTDANGNLAESFGQVCNSQFPSPAANIGWARSYENGLGWGIGLFTPAGVPAVKFGNDTNITKFPAADEPYQITATGVESPTRQLVLKQSGVLANLMLGLGYQPVKFIRFGASAGIGLAYVNSKNMASSTGGTFNDQEIVSDVAAKDYFIPRATAALTISPFDAVDVFGTLTYQDDIRASGHTDLTVNGVLGAPRKSCYDASPGTNCRIDNVHLRVPLPTLEATFGLRVAMKRNPRERVLDPMKDEVFDIEVDASWAQTSHVDNFTLDLHDKMLGADGAPFVQYGNGPTASKLPVQPQIKIPKYWKDTWTVRAGTDWNVIAERLTLRLGGSFATSAVPASYMNIDYMPVQKVGAHAGLTIALSRYRISLGYAHIFYQTVNVNLGQGKVLDIAVNNASGAQAVNEGRFTGGLDVFSLQMNARF